MRTKNSGKQNKPNASQVLESGDERRGLKKASTNGQTETSNHDPLSDAYNSRELLRVLMEVKNGNFTVRMPIHEVGVNGKIYDTLNEIISLNERMMLEFTRAGNTIGKEGKLTQRIELPSTKGSWSHGVNSLNVLISDLVHPTIEIAHVISSVSKGNLSQQMPEEIGDHKLEGEFLRIAKEVNYMVKQLNLFSMEVTRVAREVGSEGKLGGQAKVKGVGGVWRDLTDSVNHMAGNLTNQVRNIAEVTTAIARGNLSKKITVDVRGEMLELRLNCPAKQSSWFHQIGFDTRIDPYPTSRMKHPWPVTERRQPPGTSGWLSNPFSCCPGFWLAVSFAKAQKHALERGNNGEVQNCSGCPLLLQFPRPFQDVLSARISKMHEYFHPDEAPMTERTRPWQSHWLRNSDNFSRSLDNHLQDCYPIRGSHRSVLIIFSENI